MIDYRVKTFLTLCNFMNYRKTEKILRVGYVSGRKAV